MRALIHRHPHHVDLAEMAEAAARWLGRLAASGLTVLLADPGRAYLPKAGLTELARYRVPTSLELEDRTERETVIWQLSGGG